jgi:GNAT superfamily N-acetyltransferase
MELSIRQASKTDLSHIIGLMCEFAAFENLSQFLEITAEKLNEAIFGANSFVDVLVAFNGGKRIGYAIFFPYFSSFRGQKSVYLEDIYITEKYRKFGIGEKMLREIARIGKEFGAVRMDFQVLDWNESAISFYKKHGAEFHESERHFLFSGTAFEKLASEM